jgi:hypothetical protein
MFENNQIIQQMELIPRYSNGSTLLVVLLFLCVVFVALARLVQQSIVSISIQNSFFFATKENQTGNGVRPNKLSRILLSLQFVVISSMFVYWFFVKDNPNNHFLFFVLMPVGYLLYQLVISFLAGNLTGQKKIAREEIYFTLALYSVLGLLLLLEFFLFYFQSGPQATAIKIVVITYLLFLGFRIVRSVFLGLSLKVSWYYIILYFWTLEILPVLIVIKLLFNGETSGIIE